MSHDRKSKAGAVWMLVSFLTLALSELMYAPILEVAFTIAWVMGIVLLLQGDMAYQSVKGVESE